MGHSVRDRVGNHQPVNPKNLSVVGLGPAPAAKAPAQTALQGAFRKFRAWPWVAFERIAGAIAVAGILWLLVAWVVSQSQ
jgi:hypothetical protein